MKILGMYLALLIGQANSLQDKPMVHLRPHQDVIELNFGGKLLEVINGPTMINLPLTIPKPDAQGIPWSIDIKNMGPSIVTVIGKTPFNLPIDVGRTVHIYSNGTAYALKQ
jgi:hypothetical protein